jgi:hypothetical protein
LRVAKSASPSPSRPPKRKAAEMSTIVKQEQMEEEENGDENEDRVVKVKKEVLPQEGVFGPVNYFYC